MNKENKVAPFDAVFRVIYCVLKFLSRILYPTTVEGLENLPPHGALLASNHASNIDPVLIITALPIDYHLYAMAKEELFRCKPFGWILRKCGAFPVSRGNKDVGAIKTAMQAIRGGDNLLIFPEGTVIRDGIGHADGLPAHAHSGTAVIGIRTGATIVPVFADGRKRLFRRSRIIFGKPYEPSFTGRHGTTEEMQQIAGEVLAQAYALGGQKVGGEPL